MIKNIETEELKLPKRDSAAIVLVFKAGAFRYYWAITYSLVVAQPIRMQHWQWPTSWILLSIPETYRNKAIFGSVAVTHEWQSWKLSMGLWEHKPWLYFRPNLGLTKLDSTYIYWVNHYPLWIFFEENHHHTVLKNLEPCRPPS